VTQTALGMRRLVGKVVLFFGGCWLIVLIAGVAGALRGAEADPVRFAILLIPGCAFVPAAYYSIGLHRTADRERVAWLWPRAVVCGIAGLGLLFGLAYSLYRMGAA
jgi:hypothetical protein